MHLSMASPNAYVQETGLLKQAGEWLLKYGGKTVFIIGGKTAWSKACVTLEPSLQAQSINYTYEQFGGECSYEEVERLQGLVPTGTDLILGVGGGRAIDTAKLVANRMGKGFVAVPTVAGTCACGTHISVVYTPKGLLVESYNNAHNAVLTLVDSDIIADSPVKYLLSGIGDTLAKWYEGIVCARGNESHVPTKLGLSAAKICLDTLLEYCEQGIKDMENKIPSYAVQQLSDAIFVSAAAVGGFGMQNTRACAAHGIHDGLSVVEETHEMLHGMKVAYGIIGLMHIDNQSEEDIAKLKDFYRRVGLPTSMNELGVKRELTEEELKKIYEISYSPGSYMQYMPYNVSFEQFAEAIRKIV